MTRIFALFFCLLPVSLFAAGNIDMAVSPIKYEISVTAGAATTKTITFYNNSADTPYNIYLSAEDCTADSTSGTPKCRPVTSTGVDLSSLASWITFDGSSKFSVPPKGEKKVTFTINTPTGAIPGGHYGAVFLNNIDTNNDGGNNVKMIRRAGVLLLVNVPGKLIYDTEIGDIAIDIPLESAPSVTGVRKKNLPKWRQIIDSAIEELDPRMGSADFTFDESDFVVTFTVPVTNKGNIHILPLGRIELYDENGMLLQKIGKEAIRSPEGVFLGERIVDYLPINDETSAVLPGSDRIFQVFWKGFAYQTIEGGAQVIKYQSPQSYYTELETQKSNVLMLWERYRVRPVKKNITAKIYLEYKGDNEETQAYDKEEVITVAYLAPQKELNYGLIAIVVLVLLMLWVLKAYRREDTRISHLEEELEYVEAEIGELEKGKALAKKALEKKAQKKSISTKMPVETPAPAKKPVAKKSPAPEAVKKPRAPRTPKSQS